MFYEGWKATRVQQPSTRPVLSREPQFKLLRGVEAAVSTAKIAAESVRTLASGCRRARPARGRKVAGRRKNTKIRERETRWKRGSDPYISSLLCISQAMEPLNPRNESIFLSPLFLSSQRDSPRGKSRRIADTNGRSWPSDSLYTALLEFMRSVVVCREFSYLNVCTGGRLFAATRRVRTRKRRILLLYTEKGGSRTNRQFVFVQPRSVLILPAIAIDIVATCTLLFPIVLLFLSLFSRWLFQRLFRRLYFFPSVNYYINRVTRPSVHLAAAYKPFSPGRFGTWGYARGESKG